MKKIKQTIERINLEAVSVGTWVRLIMVCLGLVIYLMQVFGIEIPAVEENQVYEIVVAVFGVIAFLQAYWKNNSFTEGAQAGDEVMRNYEK